MELILAQRSEAHAKRRNIVFSRELGCGIHGVVLVADDKTKIMGFAVKFHPTPEAYLRERTIYQRLAECQVAKLCGQSEHTRSLKKHDLEH